jgi:hypothetical protein
LSNNVLNVDKMNKRQLQEYLELILGAEEEQRNNDLEQLLEQKIMITGQGGQGKTTAAVCMSYDMRELKGRPIFAVGARMGLNRDTFGEFQEIDEFKFIEQLRKLNLAIGKEAESENAEQVYQLLKDQGVDIYGGFLVFDEARNFFDNRKSQDKLVNIANDFIAVCRHYRVTVLLLAPDESEIDQRTVRQMQWKGACFYNPITEVEKVHLNQRNLYDIHLQWDTEAGYTEGMLHPSYHSMFNTHNLVSTGRKNSLDKMVDKNTGKVKV